MSARLTKAQPNLDEAGITAAFARERLSPHKWSNGPGDTYAPHSHAYHKVLYCIRGSIIFQLTRTGDSIELHSGDRLDIEPNTEHSATVGPNGVDCIEAAR
jgi:quercetin dioxygenase-like cupin family protein